MCMCRPQQPLKEVLRSDLKLERPLWVLSCYGHDRNGPNDLTGDVSPEEARGGKRGVGDLVGM